MRLMLPVLAAGLVLSVAIQPAALAQSRGRVTVYKDANFQGDRRTLDGEIRDFNAIGLNDRVSSIRVDSGTWEFCADADFQGRCITVSDDVSDLAGSGLDDHLSSARPLPDRGGRDDGRRGGTGQGGGYDRRGGNDQRGNGPGGYDARGPGGYDQRGGGNGVILYADIGFGGDSRTASGTVSDFRSIRFNDAVSSIRILSGSWQFCSDADFQGRCMTFDRDVPTLVPMGFNDGISSMRQVR